MNLRSLSLLGATLLFAGLLQTAGSPQAAASPQRAALGAKKAAPSPYAAGVADMKARKWSQAEAQFRRAISRKDHLERAYAGLGTAAAWLGDYKTAVTAFKRAVALDANDGEAQARGIRSIRSIRSMRSIGSSRAGVCRWRSLRGDFR